MNIRNLILGLLAVAFVSFTSGESYAQVFGKSKKELQKENEQLRKKIDSLKALLADAIELSDTTSFDDEDTWGAFEEAEALMNENGVPGSNSDSLLAVWYAQRALKGIPDQTEEIDQASFSSDVPDDIIIGNIKKMNSLVQIPYNQIVKNHIVFYTQKIPKKSATILGLCSYYMPIFEEVFDSYDLPKELCCLAIIESALNPFAVSRAKAKGPWQFMLKTAKIYGLEVNSYVDERFDPEKSAHAAARYLRDAYAIFGDWALAISSYNCGSGNVNKAIRKAGGSKNFWDIYEYLPRETRGYMPAFVGALYLTHYYKNYNIVPEKISLPPHVDTFRIHKNLHFEQIADNMDISVEELRVLNPQYIQDIIPGGNTEGYILKLPYNYTLTFVDKEKEIYAYKDSIYFNPILYSRYKDEMGVSSGEQQRIVHKVKKGQTLGQIARKYGVSVSQLQKWNNLKGTNLRVGQNISIYKGGKAPSASKSSGSAKSSNNGGGNSSSASSGSGSSGGTKTYTVKKGDTLYGIARANGMSLNDLLKLNGLTTKSKIYPGKKIKIKG